MIKRQKYRPRGAAYIRTECLVEGCQRLQRNKGKDYLGITRWDKYCDKHHKMRFKVKLPSGEFFKLRVGGEIDNSKCVKCGWEGPCDRHRKEPEKGYIPENVVVLCPNCHRLQSMGVA